MPKFSLYLGNETQKGFKACVVPAETGMQRNNSSKGTENILTALPSRGLLKATGGARAASQEQAGAPPPSEAHPEVS